MKLLQTKGLMERTIALHARFPSCTFLSRPLQNNMQTDSWTQDLSLRKQAEFYQDKYTFNLHRYITVYWRKKTPDVPCVLNSSFLFLTERCFSSINSSSSNGLLEMSSAFSIKDLFIWSRLTGLARFPRSRYTTKSFVKISECSYERWVAEITVFSTEI